MTDIVIYCEECEEDVLVTKIEVHVGYDTVSIELTLECGHEYLKRRLRFDLI